MPKKIVIPLQYFAEQWWENQTLKRFLLSSSNRLFSTISLKTVTLNSQNRNNIIYKWWWLTTIFNHKCTFAYFILTFKLNTCRKRQIIYKSATVNDKSASVLKLVVRRRERKRTQYTSHISYFLFFLLIWLMWLDGTIYQL